jgi:hypothetical protein
LQLLDADGQPMQRKLGRTWIQIINSMNEVEMG